MCGRIGGHVLVFGAALLVGGAASSRAAVFTFSASASPGSNPDANAGAVNAWVTSHSTTNTSQAGDFIGNSASNGGAAGAGTSAWAMYANNGQTARSTATVATLVGSNLTLTNQFVSLDFDNGFIDSGNQVGINFLNGSGVNQLTFRFVGGASFYEVQDSTGTHATTQGFTRDGFNVSLTLNAGSGAYTLKAGSATISGVLQTAVSNLGGVQVYNANAGGGSDRDLYFNNLVISTSVPEASPLLAAPVVLSVAAALYFFNRRRRRMLPILAPA